MQVEEIIKLIPSTKINFLAKQTGVNHKAKKLDGKIFFQLLLYAVLTTKEGSLRVFENVFNSYYFQKITNHKGQIKYNSLSDRFLAIDSLFFKKLYEECVKQYKSYFPTNNKLLSFDSTLVSLSAKLLSIGFQCGGSQQHVKQLKFTIGFSDIAEFAVFNHDKTYNSENIALSEAILAHPESKESTVLFDRGLHSRPHFDRLTNENISFITRFQPKYKADIVEEIKINQTTESGLNIYLVRLVYLYSRRNERTKHSYKIIHCRSEKGDEFDFLTNIKHEEEAEIVNLYKKRWEIEVFFKFLKQNLNFSHLVSRNENGIRIMLYVAMIASILLTVYKKTNKLKGYKISKLQFSLKLEESIVKHIVKIAGGDPDKIDAAHSFW